MKRCVLALFSVFVGGLAGARGDEFLELKRGHEFHACAGVPRAMVGEQNIATFQGLAYWRRGSDPNKGERYVDVWKVEKRQGLRPYLGK